MPFPILPLTERKALADRLRRYQRLPYLERGEHIRELCRAYGVTARTGYRYAKRLREHSCVCRDCGRTL